MRLFQIGTLIALFGLTVLGFQNCAQRGQISAIRSSGDSAATEKSMKDLEGQIKTLSARDLSCDVAADCTVVSVGGAHCGGPTFLVLSSKRSGDYRSVVEMADSFKQIESSYMQSNGLVGSCNMLTAPTPKCVSNQCVN